MYVWVPVRVSDECRTLNIICIYVVRSGKADAVNNCQFRRRESAGEMVTKFTASLTAEIRISFLARLLFRARAFCAREVFVVAFHANIDGPRPCADTPLDEILRVGYY